MATVNVKVTKSRHHHGGGGGYSSSGDPYVPRWRKYAMPSQLRRSDDPLSSWEKMAMVVVVVLVLVGIFLGLYFTCKLPFGPKRCDKYKPCGQGTGQACDDSSLTCASDSVCRQICTIDEDCGKDNQECVGGTCFTKVKECTDTSQCSAFKRCNDDGECESNGVILGVLAMLFAALGLLATYVYRKRRAEGEDLRESTTRLVMNAGVKPTDIGHIFLKDLAMHIKTSSMGLEEKMDLVNSLIELSTDDSFTLAEAVQMAEQAGVPDVDQVLAESFARRHYIVNPLKGKVAGNAVFNTVFGNPAVDVAANILGHSQVEKDAIAELSPAGQAAVQTALASSLERRFNGMKDADNAADVLGIPAYGTGTPEQDRLRKWMEKASEFSAKKRKSEPKNIAPSLGALSEVLETPGAVVKRSLYSKVGGIGKTQSVANWLHANPGGVVFPVTRPLLNLPDYTTTGADPSTIVQENLSAIIAAARQNSQSGRPAMIMLDESQELVREPFFQQILLRELDSGGMEGVSIVSMSNVDLTRNDKGQKDPVAAAIVSRLGGQQLFGTPKFTQEERERSLRAVIEFVQNKTGEVLTIPEEEFSDIAHQLYEKNFKEGGFRAVSIDVSQRLENAVIQGNAAYITAEDILGTGEKVLWRTKAKRRAKEGVKRLGDTMRR